MPGVLYVGKRKKEKKKKKKREKEVKMNKYFLSRQIKHNWFISLDLICCVRWVCDLSGFEQLSLARSR